MFVAKFAQTQADQPVSLQSYCQQIIVRADPIGLMSGLLFMKSRILLLLVAFLNIGGRAAESPFLYGIHDHEPDPSEFLNHIKAGTGGTGGWVTATVAVGADPNDLSGTDFSALANAGHTVICRINYGYFPDGTIPVVAEYDAFAVRCKNFVANSTGCSMWLIGNESNLNVEWPLDPGNNRFNYLSPVSYALCFRKCYNSIKSIRPNDKVMPQALAPWGGPYGGTANLNGSGYPADGMPLNWVQYSYQMLSNIHSSGPLDGIPLHVGSRGYRHADIHSLTQVNAGGQNLFFSFYVYKDWIAYGIPSLLYHLPLYVTECNGLFYWKGGGPPGEDLTKQYEAGWTQEVFAEINRHNQSAATNGRPIFRCVNFYRWCGFCDGWNIDGASNTNKAQILADLEASVAQLYRWPTNVIYTNPPPAPTSLTAIVGYGNVTLNWSSGGFADTFRVKRATATNGPYSTIASNLTGASYINTSFVPNTTYFYRVSGVNPYGEGDDSNTASATPTNGLPDVIVTGISWTAPHVGPGTNVVFRATVRNQGEAATPAGVTLGVGFLVDGNQYSWSGGYSSGLPAGSSIVLTADGGPVANYWPATAGPHTLSANVDDINRFPEGNEANNVFGTNLMVFAPGYALNAGGNASGNFVADNFWSGSANLFAVTNAIDTNGVAFAAPQLIYQTERWGNVSYVLPNLVPGIPYTVRLHFAEISPSVTATNDRLFHVLINGAHALTNCDILADAGAKFRAMTRSFDAIADSNGTISIGLVHGDSNEAKLNGVEILPPANVSISCRLNGSSLLIQWPGYPGKSYRVQFKNTLDATSWSNLAGDVLGTGGVVSKSDALGSSTRFYRVLVLN